MARKPDLPCAGCGELMWSGRSSLPPGQAMCLPCRRLGLAPQSAHGRMRRYRSGCRCAACKQASSEWLAEQRARKVASGNVCTIDGCGKPHSARGLCSTHYNLAHPRKTATPTRPGSTGSTSWISAAERYAIYARDGWVCWICNEPVDRDADILDNRYPSLDHVLPRKHGGTHSPNNLRTAHRQCNSKRGAGEEWSLAFTVRQPRPKPKPRPKAQVKPKPTRPCRLCGAETTRRAYCSADCMREGNARGVREAYRAKAGLPSTWGVPTRPRRGRQMGDF